MSKVSL
jgi:2-(3-amino-3-carboxypropyl)histidine synthase